MIAYPMESVFHALKNSIQLFFVQKIDMVLTIKEMLKISTLARKKGVLELESYKTKDLFLKKSLNLLVDGSKGEFLREILEMERDALEERHSESQAILEKMGDLAPAWGMIGTLIGLVIMLLNLDDPSSIGPAMAVALLTTFYGAFWANFMLIPAANKLEERTKRESQNISLIIESLISVSIEENPNILKERLLGLLPPKDRKSVMPKKAKKKG